VWLSVSTARRDFFLDVSDKYGHVVVEIEVVTGKNPRPKLRRGSLRPPRHFFVGGDSVVITQESEDRA
jgi:hypothetical protein